jgi:hypothetical protein
MMGLRERVIEEQADRNRRMKRVTTGQRKRVGKDAKAVFHCQSCDRDVFITWQALRGVGQPKCRECDRPLTLVTACLNRGVLPRA